MVSSTSHPRLDRRFQACRADTSEAIRAVKKLRTADQLKLRGRAITSRPRRQRSYAAWVAATIMMPGRVCASTMSSIGEPARWCREECRAFPFRRRTQMWRRRSQIFLPFGLSLPVAWLDSYGRRRHVGPWSQEFSPAGFPRKRGPRPAFLAHAPAAPKFVAPAGAQRCACPPLASGGSGSVSSSRP